MKICAVEVSIRCGLRLAACAALFFASWMTAQQSAAPAQQPPTMEQARDLAQHGRLEQAMAILDQLAAQSPEPAGTERLRGEILYQREQLPQAVAAFQKALAQDATDNEAMEMEGVALVRMGKDAEALPLLEKSHTAVSNVNVDPQYVLGLCYTDLQRYDDARRAFAAQFGFEPESAEAHFLAGWLFFRREFVAVAEGEARKALALRPQLPLAHQLLGEAALARGDLPAAVTELEAERAANPMDGGLYDRLGDAYLRSGDLDKAQGALNRAVLLEPGATAPFLLLGETYLKMKQPVQALQYLDHAERMDPSNYQTHYNLGMAYKAVGRLDDAEREMKLSTQLQHKERPVAPGK